MSRYCEFVTITKKKKNNSKNNNNIGEYNKIISVRPVYFGVRACACGGARLIGHTVRAASVRPVCTNHGSGGFPIIRAAALL